MNRSFRRSGNSNIPFKRRRKAPFRRPGSKTDVILTVILAISIIIALSMTIYVIITPKTGEKCTEFYILGPNGTASDYPTNLKLGAEGEVIIVIVDHEYANISYRLGITWDGEVLEEKTMVLSNNETWKSPFKFKANNKGENQKLELLLFKAGEKQVYRSLHLWVDVT
ncbi:MAG: DUF1616 domain-containing protein [Halobacteriota archaeon]